MPNKSITPDIKPIVERLNAYISSPAFAKKMKDAWGKAKALYAKNKISHATIEIDLPAGNPPEVASCRLSILQPKTKSHVERHANSAQYIYAIEGVGVTGVEMGGRWRVDTYGGKSKSLEDRWHATPAGTWHYSLAPEAGEWVIMAFHTAKKVSDERRD